MHTVKASGVIRHLLNPKSLVCWPAKLSPILELMKGLKPMKRASVHVKIAMKIARNWLPHARANGKPLPEGSKAALVITAEPEVREALRQSLSTDWLLLPADTLYQAIEVISREEIGIVFCDCEARNLDWRKAVSVLSRPPFRSCVIVLSSFVCRNFWEEVAPLGRYEVLSKPLATNKVLRVARAAWSYWRSQQALHLWCQTNHRGVSGVRSPGDTLRWQGMGLPHNCKVITCTIQWRTFLRDHAFRTAYKINSGTPWRFSFSIMLLRCVSTVYTLTFRRFAISSDKVNLDERPSRPPVCCTNRGPFFLTASPTVASVAARGVRVSARRPTDPTGNCEVAGTWVLK